MAKKRFSKKGKLISAAFPLFLLLASVSNSSGLSFQAGALYGLRQVADAEIKNVYGHGFVYFPFAEIVWKGIIIGGGYEGGYSRQGQIGLFKEPSTLKVSGYEVFIGGQFKIKIIAPYFKIGYASYAYKQTIESPYLAEFKVDHKKSTALIAAGLRLFPLKNLFLSAELKYVPLKVKPYDEEVDLGGFRFLAGLGLSF